MADPKSLREVAAIVDRISYKDWVFRLLSLDRAEVGDLGFLLQARWMGPDAEDFYGEPVQQVSRKWFVSAFSCEREIVDTAWALIERAEIHEAQEFFRYQGEAIFNRHIKPEALLRVARDVQTRESG